MQHTLHPSGAIHILLRHIFGLSDQMIYHFSVGNQNRTYVFIDIFLQFQPERVRICEHCLKITRAPSAYEQCCTDQDNAFSWCRRIYHFSQSNGKR